MVGQRLTLRLEVDNGQFVGGMRVSGTAVDRFTDRVRKSDQASERYNRPSCSPPTRG